MLYQSLEWSIVIDPLQMKKAVELVSLLTEGKETVDAFLENVNSIIIPGMPICLSL